MHLIYINSHILRQKNKQHDSDKKTVLYHYKYYQESIIKVLLILRVMIIFHEQIKQIKFYK